MIFALIFKKISRQSIARLIPLLIIIEAITIIAISEFDIVTGINKIRINIGQANEMKEHENPIAEFEALVIRYFLIFA